MFDIEKESDALLAKKREENIERIKARAKSIIESGFSHSLFNIAGFVEHATRGILELVLEACNGAPRVVLPPYDEKYEEPWEGTMYGIFRTEESLHPYAMFPSSVMAMAEMDRRQNLDSDSDDDWLSTDCCVLRCNVAMNVWNSLDPDPRA